MRDADCVAFLQWALPRMGLRWEGFRRPRRQVCRRIARRMRQLAMEDLEGYRLLLVEGAAEWKVLDALCRVTISRFCRDRGVWKDLGRRVLPELARGATRSNRSVVRVWSAGCASGEEPYSLSLVWRFEVAPRFPALELEVVATDVDDGLLERARRAIYPKGCLRELPPTWRRLAFAGAETGQGAGAAPEGGSPGDLRLRAEYRRGIELLRQDVRYQAPEGFFDLVLCRNVVWTYCDDELQKRVLSGLLTVLRRDGFLVVGAHESLPTVEDPSRRLEEVAPAIHRRPGEG